MVNRRYLRIKVYQALYAHWQGDRTSSTRLGKELVQGIDRTNDLYLGLLLVFGELRHVAEQRMEERRKKHLPTEGDLNPDRRFVDNVLIAGIATSDRLQQECDKRRISWVGFREVFTALYKSIEESEEFKAYMQAPSPTFSQQRELVVRLFSEMIANDEHLQEVFESRSIFWMEDLDLAATMVKRGLESWKESGHADDLLDGLSLDPAEEKSFVGDLFRRTIELGDEHEALIAERASNWEADRIALSDMILMKMALTEVRIFEQIPIKVTMNEYIEIAKAYSTPKSKNFINGVLDKIFIEMKADGRISKVGRGLLES
ncbi:MAG: transcription antitermination protein NusB [Flavobacteriales bacterium]|nr:transcription antitermination protein NusB [Flavobacteriales bacterium]MCC6936901.1 transcription antitermination protein NusB [Flavobacteriales bacterium]